MAALAGLEDSTDRGYKHLHLYNFVALSLVRQSRGDVCAVTVYQSLTSVEVCFAKNAVRQADNEKLLDNIHSKNWSAM